MHRPSAAKVAILAVMLCLSLVAVGCSTQASSQPQQTIAATDFLKQVKTIDLPGQGGHGDIVAYDPSQKMVYVAQTPDDNIIVISTETQDIKKVIPGIKGVNGIAFGPKYMYAAAGADNKLVVIEKGTWNVVASVDTSGKTPDAVYYDAKDSKLFVANDDTNNMAVIASEPPFNLKTTLALSKDKAVAGPDLGVYIASKNRLYQSVDDYILVIDTTTNKIVDRFETDVKVTAKGGTKDMIYDPGTNLIWMATTAKKVLVINPETGERDEIATSSGADQITWDPASHMLFLGESASGSMEVIDMKTKTVIGAIDTEKGFHTLDVDTDKHMVYAYLNYFNKMAIYQENMNLLK